MPRKFLRQVTVTGADDSIAPETIVCLAREYPYAEFGILCSKNNAGMSRFPSQKWLDTMSRIKEPTTKLSMHLCGTWVRSLCTGDRVVSNDWIASYFGMFNRIQLNFHGQPHRANSSFVRALWDFKAPIIFQIDGVNQNLYAASKTYHVDSYALFDLSGGAGVLPEEWPKPDGEYCGYAGGLSPENLAENLAKLSGIVGEIPIWVDAETHLRSDDDRRFDLDKVGRFLDAAEPYVREK